MADEGSKIPGPFDVRTIKELVGLMSRHDLSEVDLREGNVRIRLRRGPKEMVTLASAAALPALPAAGAAAPAAGAPPAPVAKSEAEPKPAKQLLEIKSPTPGTFYSSSAPEADPFVRVGTRVNPATVVCLIEAMKIFNEITADFTGVIAEILVETQQPVEYGQVLFRVDPTS